MESRMDPAVLGARALVLASVTCFLGIAGHVGADGLLPGAPTLALLVAGVAVASLALLARPASTHRVVSLLVLGQTAVHLVLSTTAGHAGDAPAVARLRPTPAALPTEGGRRVGSLSDQYAATLGGRDDVAPVLPVGHLVADLSDHAPMMAAHLAAAVLVGLWLAVGEHALWTLLALAAGAVVRPLLLALTALAGAAAPLRPATVPPRHAPVPPILLLLARCVVRRGPPVLLAA
ncbi:hypothetical protein H5V45_21100 [Nocardioides sp. KIGAM211]|uniref:Uncharacterized protein n=1 Tax=Nocardioides luti TaxID=2761101 RepID=A0A7X0RK95_9ACTN|nr:hypothetical protein [Nocardioides luti]MBB6629829.1 hypothetical protein [Nocardioides luti]